MKPSPIERVLFTETEIQECVLGLARRISEDYRGRSLVLVGALKGAFVFLADLARALSIPHEIDFIRASSYGNASSSSGRVHIACDVSLDLKDKHVLLVEDIYDTGRTMAKLLAHLAAKSPASLEVCALLVKNRPQEAAPGTPETDLVIRYTGFEVEDCFVVGYGLDFAEQHRHLPCMGILRQERAAEPRAKV